MSEESPAEWFVRGARGERGPLSPNELRELVRTGELFPMDQLRRSATGPWRPASAVRGLFPERTTPYDVFVSYSNKNKPAVDQIVHHLEREGIRCWVAPRDIPAGANWGEAIIGGISTSRVLLLVLSQHSNTSQQILQEVERAVAKGLIVVPFRIEDVPVSAKLELYVGARHWLDAFSEPLEVHSSELAQDLRRILGTPTAKKAKEDPAREAVESVSLRSKAWLGWAAGALVLGAGGFLGWKWNQSQPQPSHAAAPRERATEVSTSLKSEGDSKSTKASPARVSEPRREVSQPTGPDPAIAAAARLATLDAQRKGMLAILKSAQAFDVVIEKAGDAGRRARLEVLPLPGDEVVLQLRDVEQPALYSLYRGVFPAVSPQASEMKLALQVDPGLASDLSKLGPLEGEPIELRPGESSGEIRVTGRSRRTFVIASAAAQPFEVMSSTTLAERWRVGRAWTGTTRNAAGVAQPVRVLVAALDTERRFVRLDVESKDDPWNPTVFTGTYSEPETPAGWVARFDKVAMGTDHESYELLSRYQSRIHLRIEPSGWFGRLATQDLMLNAFTDGVEVTDKSMLLETTTPGTIWKGTSRVPGKKAVSITLAFTAAGNDLDRIRCRATLDEKLGIHAAYVGAAALDDGALGSWPLKLTKKHNQPVFSEEHTLFNRYQQELQLRPVHNDRLVGRCGQEFIDLKRVTEELPVEELDAPRRLLTLLSKGNKFKGNAKYRDDAAFPIELTVLECSEDGTILSLEFRAKAYPQQIPIFRGSLRLEDSLVDTWPIGGKREFASWRTGDKGMFGNFDGTDLVHLRPASDGGLEGWCGPQWIELKRK